MSPHPAPSSEGCRSLGCPTAILPLAAVVGLRWRGPGVWREGKGMKAATAQFQGGAGRIRNIHGIGPELVADEGRAAIVNYEAYPHNRQYGLCRLGRRRQPQQWRADALGPRYGILRLLPFGVGPYAGG